MMMSYVKGLAPTGMRDFMTKGIGLFFLVKGLIWLVVLLLTGWAGLGMAADTVPTLDRLPPPTIGQPVAPAAQTMPPPPPSPQPLRPLLSPHTQPKAVLPAAKDKLEALGQSVKSNVLGDTEWVRQVAIVPVGQGPYQQVAFQRVELLVAEALAFEFRRGLAADTVKVSSPAYWQQTALGPKAMALQSQLAGDWATYGQPSPATLEALATVFAPAQRLVLVQSQVRPRVLDGLAGWGERMKAAFVGLWQDPGAPVAEYELYSQLWVYDAATLQPLDHAELSERLPESNFYGVTQDIGASAYGQGNLQRAAMDQMGNLSVTRWRSWLRTGG